jgi:hypothetical protein
MQLVHVWNGRSDNRTHAALSMTDTKTLCNQGLMQRNRGDRTIPNMFEINKPIDCAQCRRTLNMIVRQQLDYMSPSQLEGLLELITKERSNGN